MIDAALVVFAGTVVAIAVALVADSWRKNREERATVRFSGRAWTASDISSTPVATSSGPRCGPGVGDSGRSGAFLGRLDDRKLVEQSRGAHLEPHSARLSAPFRPESDLLDPRNTNARAHGTGVR